MKNKSCRLDSSRQIRCPRIEIQQIGEVAPVRGESLNQTFVEHIACGRVVGLQHLRVGAYCDLLQPGPDLQREILSQRLIHLQRKLRRRSPLEAVLFGGKGVKSGNSGLEYEIARSSRGELAAIYKY